MFDKIIKKNIKNIIRVDNTIDDRSDYLKFEKNERLCDFNGELFQKFISNIKSSDLSIYPSLEKTYKKLANFMEINRNQVFLASGSDLAIKSIYEACIEENDKIVLPSFCYAMYNVYGKMFGAEIKIVEIKEDWSFNIDTMLKVVDEKTKLFVLENPSGTFGYEPLKEEIIECCEFLKNKNIIFLLDEAYHKLNKNDINIKEFIDKYPNAIISRSFSKFPGLAGLRIGFLIGNHNLLQNISKVKPMHEITSISALAIEWVIDNPVLEKEYYIILEDSRKYLKNQFDMLKIKYKDSNTNFIFAYLPDEGKTKNLTKKLEDYKILLKQPFNKGCLKGWVRITIGNKEDSKKLIDSIHECLSEE
jgi:histidinol-phosphate aminotransferase